MDHISQFIEQYGIYAVFALCTVEGDITLLLSGAMAHGGLFGKYSFFRVFLAGTLGGIVGDCIAYTIGRVFRKTIQNYRFYKIYGLRGAMCIFYGIGRMPFHRFLLVDAISCAMWVFILTSVGYFFSGAITGIIGDVQQYGIWILFIVLTGILLFYVVERYYLSEKVEETKPETIHKIEETIHKVEEVAHGKLHDLGERLHLTASPNKKEEALKKKEVVSQERD
jgi:membrane protein DedA with SNARE-associated domain